MLRAAAVVQVLLESTPRSVARRLGCSVAHAHAAQLYVVGTLVVRYRLLVTQQPVGDLPRRLHAYLHRLPPALRQELLALLEERAPPTVARVAAAESL